MTIKIVYETQTGTTQYVAEVMQRALVAAGHTVNLHSVRYDGFAPNLEGVDLLLFGGPTYDDGLLEKTLRDFIEQFKPDLSNRKLAVFGLGNTSFPQFCKAADVLEAWVAERGGALVLPSLRIDGWPDHLEKIQGWCSELAKLL